jgi:hypothetical protein
MNFSTETQLLLRTPDLAHALLDFNLDALPEGAQVQNAQLRLYVVDETLSPNVVVKCYPLLRDWDAGIVNWTKAASGVPWSSPGASGPEDRGDAIALSDELVPGSYFSLDVTDVVQDWLADPNSQHGILLAARSEAEEVIHLASFEHSVSDWRPRLEIIFSP